MSRQLQILVTWTDEAWKREGERDLDGTVITPPSKEEVRRYFEDYASGADMSDGITYEASWVEGSVDHE